MARSKPHLYFLLRTGSSYYGDRHTGILGNLFPKVGLAGDTLAIIMTLGTLSFLVTTPEVWVPDLGSGEFGFPLLSGAGRLVIKDIVILASAVVLLSDSSQRVLKTLKKTKTTTKEDSDFLPLRNKSYFQTVI